MTPDLMEAGAGARAGARRGARGQAGGRRPASAASSAGEPDFTHGVALYLDDITRQLRRLQGAQRSCA